MRFVELQDENLTIDNSEDELIENYCMNNKIYLEKPKFFEKENQNIKNLNLDENESDEKGSDILKLNTNRDTKTQTQRKLESSNQNINFSSQNIQNSTGSQISKYQQWRNKNTNSIDSLKDMMTKTFVTTKYKTFGSLKSISEEQSDSKNQKYLEKNANLNQNKNHIIDEIFTHFDKICSFNNYFPLNNYQGVLRKYNHLIKGKKLLKLAPITVNNITQLIRLSILKKKIKFVRTNKKNKSNTNKKKAEFSETSIINDLKHSGIEN